ncbi:MAG: NAD(P)-binding domain-containing protein [Chloroflexi bacterium]|nr:NAD(P)-binding domain-containing protein [Chloroflexota bacterium]
MKMGVLGSGMVGQAISARLAELDHDVMIGTRNAAKLKEWQSINRKVKIGSFAETAAHGGMVFNATLGTASLDVLKMAGEPNLNSKIVVDISNPLDFSKGFPPSLTVSDTDSLAEQIQRAHPSAKVVKTLNTIIARIMVYPREVADGDHHIFISANDAGAKAQVAELLKSFGWLHIIDLGDLSTARGTEMYLSIWLRLWGALGTGNFNIKIVK